jgi:hypothetical protein
MTISTTPNPPTRLRQNLLTNSFRSVQREDENMGIQSQRRIGEIERCRQRGASRQTRAYRQAAVNDISTDGFVSLLHCEICKGNEANKINKALNKPLIRVPHRPHDKRCTKNGITSGLSETTVQSNLFSNYLDRRNSLPMSHGNPYNDPSVALHFGINVDTVATTANNESALSNAASETAETQIEEPRNEDEWITSDHCTAEIAEFFCKEVDSKMTQKIPRQANACKAPVPFLIVVNKILEQIAHKKSTRYNDALPGTMSFVAAYERYMTMFGESSTFTIPKSIREDNPNPCYHSIEGAQYIHLDWKLRHPNLVLHCVSCGSSNLRRERNEYNNHGHLQAILDSKNEIWVNVVSLTCEDCEVRFDTNDGRLLASLPAYIRNEYPVDPRYTSGMVHLSRDLSDELYDEMKSYSSAPAFSRKLYGRKSSQYLRRLEDYLSRSGPSPPDYPKMEQVVRTFSPSGKDLRDLYFAAEKSALNPEGISNEDRYEREQQSVEIGELNAMDHTFGMLQNYILPGGYAVFTWAKGTSETVAAAIVPSTAMEHAAHLIEQVVRKRNKGSKKLVNYTDTWPSNKEFYEMLLGPTFVGRLGLFHFMQRITDHLECKNPHYWKALVSLQQKIYRYWPGTEDALILALSSGTMAKDGQKYTSQEIRALKHSKRWNERYSKYLPKEILGSQVIAQGLDDWYSEMEPLIINDRRLLKTSKNELIQSINLAKTHAEDIQDAQGVEVYRKVPPGPRSTHGLTTYLSLRPESKLEKNHGDYKHYANTGMRPELADILTLRGMVERNVVIRWRLALSEAMAEEGRVFKYLPAHLRETPPHLNHSLLAYLNQKATSRGCTSPFSKVRDLPPNNGEVFLSKYFKEQLRRNELQKDLRKALRTPQRLRCLCKDCSNHDIPLEHHFLIASENEPEQVVRERTIIDTATGETETLTIVCTKAFVTTTHPQIMQPSRPMPSIPIAPLPDPPTPIALLPIPLSPLLPTPPPPIMTFKQWTPRRLPIPPAVSMPAPPYGWYQQVTTPFTSGGQQICCMPYFQYCQRIRQTGRKPPGRPPHDVMFCDKRKKEKRKRKPKESGLLDGGSWL